MTTTPPEMAAALARMWTKFQPEMEQRLGLIETAAEAVTVGNLTEAQREAAHAAAHKLAGSLGLFGMSRGTEAARAIEHALEASSAISAAELAPQVADLRQIIASQR